MYRYVTDDYWCDIGDVDAYIQANLDVMDGKGAGRHTRRELRPGVWAGRGTVVEGSATIEGPCIFGADCHIREGAVIGSHTVIGDNCVVKGHSSIKRSIIWKSAVIGEKAELRGCVVCGRAIVESGASAFEGSVVGEGSRIGERAIIRPSVKIWPGKYIDHCMEAGSNVVWGSKAGRNIFGSRASQAP